jgi:hypothetical protein
MHLYYFKVPMNETLIRIVSDEPIEVNDLGIMNLTIQGENLLMPASWCFYNDGTMCLYTAPKEYVELMDKATDTLDSVVVFFSGFQKFVAPVLKFLTGSEKAMFRDALYSLNSYNEYNENVAYHHALALYLENESHLNFIGEKFNPVTFFKAIRKGNV